MRGGKIGIEIESLLILRNRFVVLPSVNENIAVDSIHDHGKWIEFERTLDLRDCLIISFQRGEMLGEPLVRGRIIRIQFNRAAYTLSPRLRNHSRSNR